MAQEGNSFPSSTEQLSVKLGLKYEENTKTRSHCARILTQYEDEKLNKDVNLVSEFKQSKLEKEAQRNWDLFYKRNTTKFFKDRHWTTREFEELCSDTERENPIKLLEVGCGVGNFIFPLLEEKPDFFFYACDFSPRAVQFVKDNPLYSCEKCLAFQCDITEDDLVNTIQENSLDLVTMIFVLSAIKPDKMIVTLKNIYKVLKPNGCILFRDYGLYDHGMLRFAPGHKLSENFYVRQDGTRAFYFSTEYLADLVSQTGFKPVSNKYVIRETVNRKEDLCVQRIFVQAKFQKLGISVSKTDKNMDGSIEETPDVTQDLSCKLDTTKDADVR